MENANISSDENQQQTNGSNMTLNPTVSAGTVDTTVGKPTQKRIS